MTGRTEMARIRLPLHLENVQRLAHVFQDEWEETTEAHADTDTDGTQWLVITIDGSEDDITWTTTTIRKDLP